MATHKPQMPQETFVKIVGDVLRSGGGTRADIVTACEKANFVMTPANVTARMRTINKARKEAGLPAVKLKDGRGRVNTAEKLDKLNDAFGELPADALETVTEETAETEESAETEEESVELETEEVSA